MSITETALNGTGVMEDAALAVFPASTVQPQPAAKSAPAGPTLASAEVTFLTTDDNKEKDSVIEVIIRDLKNDIVARVSNSFGEFAEHSTNGPFTLVILNQAPLSTLRPGGSVNLHFTPQNPGVPVINPNNDEWHFNLFVDLVFSDDSHVANSENGLRMSAGAPQQTFGL